MPSAADVRPLFRNLRFINRDRAHASRRVVKRPWTADDTLMGVHQQLINNKDSMTSVIENSHVLKIWYKEYQKSMETQSIIYTNYMLEKLKKCIKNGNPKHGKS